jgi:putative hydrolase of the HAD superfamily
MRQSLLIDADDTLWENNIYFEQATHHFLDFLDHSRLSRAEVRLVIDEIEKLMGYGTANFTRSLLEAYQRLAEKEVNQEDLQQVRLFGEQINSHPLELLEGVHETLAYLATRHDLTLLTKGNQEEQKLKIERSGIEEFFQQALIVPEKNQETYEQVVGELQLDPRKTWMIGNSPRSDINPALAVGLNAVFIPHPHTWHLEHEETATPEQSQLLVLTRFSELQTHFS